MLKFCTCKHSRNRNKIKGLYCRHSITSSTHDIETKLEDAIACRHTHMKMKNHATVKIKTAGK